VKKHFEVLQATSRITKRLINMNEVGQYLLKVCRPTRATPKAVEGIAIPSRAITHGL